MSNEIHFSSLEHVKTIRGLATYLTDDFKKEFVLEGDEHNLRLGVKEHDDSIPKYFIEFGYFGFGLIPDKVDYETAPYLNIVIDFISVSNQDDWFIEPRYYLVVMRDGTGNCTYLAKNDDKTRFKIMYGKEEEIHLHEENLFTKNEITSVVESAKRIQSSLGYPSNQLRDLIWANKVEVIE